MITVKVAELAFPPGSRPRRKKLDPLAAVFIGLFACLFVSAVALAVGSGVGVMQISDPVARGYLQGIVIFAIIVAFAAAVALCYYKWLYRWAARTERTAEPIVMGVPVTVVPIATEYV